MFNNFSFHILLMPILAKSAYGGLPPQIYHKIGKTHTHTHTHTHKLSPISMAKFYFGFFPKRFNLV